MKSLTASLVLFAAVLAGAGASGAGPSNSASQHRGPFPDPIAAMCHDDAPPPVGMSATSSVCW
jgi:hypothetical protein